jgi:hypothetical protein
VGASKRNGEATAGKSKEPSDGKKSRKFDSAEAEGRAKSSRPSSNQESRKPTKGEQSIHSVWRSLCYRRISFINWANITMIGCLLPWQAHLHLLEQGIGMPGDLLKKATAFQKVTDLSADS